MPLRCPHGPGVLARKLVQFGSVRAVAATIRFSGYEDRGCSPMAVRTWMWKMLPDVAARMLKHGGNRNPRGIGGRGGKVN